MYIYDEIDPMIIGNSISNNTSELGGGIACTDNCNPIITNCTISENIANYFGGGLFVNINCNPIITNSIFWADEALLSGNELYLNTEDCDPDFYYNDIHGGINSFGIVAGCSFTGIYVNNIDSNPFFIDIGLHPYSIDYNSPCINAGKPDTTGLFLPQYDLADNPRIFNDRIDIGAYEWQGVEIQEEEIPHNSFIISYISNYPNPFNSTTTISFSLIGESKVDLIVFNLKGQRVISLINNDLVEGDHSVVWNGIDETGKSVSSGVYFYRLQINGKDETKKKCILLK